MTGIGTVGGRAGYLYGLQFSKRKNFQCCNQNCPQTSVGDQIRRRFVPMGLGLCGRPKVIVRGDHRKDGPTISRSGECLIWVLVV